MKRLNAPFPWFGGKTQAVDLVWRGLGTVDAYVEPFFGSGAVLLNAPRITDHEVVNDNDCLLMNFWRAVKADPEGVAHYADNPSSALDYRARAKYLRAKRKETQELMLSDPFWYDVNLAGWWVWTVSMDIGVGRALYEGSKEPTMQRMGTVWTVGVHPMRTPMFYDEGDNRLYGWMRALQTRLAKVEALCGDWSQAVQSKTIIGNVEDKIAGIFLDPPYVTRSSDPSSKRLYQNDSLDIADSVWRWALEHGDDPSLRICVSGYRDDFKIAPPNTWTRKTWVRSGGMELTGLSTRGSSHREETLWFSPHCFGGEQGILL